MGTIKVWTNGVIVDMDEDEVFPGGRPAAFDTPPPPKRYSKRKLFAELSNEEFALFELAEKQQDKRKARMFREATELNEADPDFPEFKAALEALYGEERAGVILFASLLS